MTEIVKDWRFDKRWMSNVVDFDLKDKKTGVDLFLSDKGNPYVLVKKKEEKDNTKYDIWEYDKQRVNLVCLMDDGRVQWRVNRYMVNYYVKNEKELHKDSLDLEILAAVRHFGLLENVSLT